MPLTPPRCSAWRNTTAARHRRWTARLFVHQKHATELNKGLLLQKRELCGRERRNWILTAPSLTCAIISDTKRPQAASPQLRAAVTACAQTLGRAASGSFPGAQPSASQAASPPAREELLARGTSQDPANALLRCGHETGTASGQDNAAFSEPPSCCRAAGSCCNVCFGSQEAGRFGATAASVWREARLLAAASPL